MEINGFTLVNEDKVNRAIFGTLGRGGALEGGVGEDASDAAKLAEYDRLGGLVRKDGRKVKTGSFYNFEGKAPHKKPVITLVMRDLEGNEVELGEDEAIPVEVQAADKIAERKAKAAGKKGKGKKAEEASEEEEETDEEEDADNE